MIGDFSPTTQTSGKEFLENILSFNQTRDERIPCTWIALKSIPWKRQNLIHFPVTNMPQVVMIMVYMTLPPNF